MVLSLWAAHQHTARCACKAHARSAIQAAHAHLFSKLGEAQQLLAAWQERAATTQAAADSAGEWTSQLLKPGFIMLCICQIGVGQLILRRAAQSAQVEITRLFIGGN